MYILLNSCEGKIINLYTDVKKNILMHLNLPLCPDENKNMS